MSAEYLIIIMLGIAILILLFGLWSSFHQTKLVCPITNNQINSDDMDYSINIMVDIGNYKSHIKGKNRILMLCIVGLLLVIMASIVLFIVFYPKVSFLPKVIVCISIIILSCVLYIIAQRKRRYQNALRKLELLILRLKLDTDEDLKSSYRLDRELEMIYRIIES